MPQQIGVTFIKGGIDNVIYYERNGKFFLRKKGNVNKSRVLKDKSFENTRRHAGQLAIASVLASNIYRKMDKNKRNVNMYRELVGKFKV
ncbi:MAG TPA: hypothetical protein VFQ58_10595, partial [Flavisolibacter sp.]|nr:hypothetical protein [Flavisolibacter sp.]